MTYVIWRGKNIDSEFASRISRNVRDRELNILYARQIGCRSIALFATESSNVTDFTQNQWSLLEATLALLQPFEEISKSVSSSYAII